MKNLIKTSCIILIMSQFHVSILAQYTFFTPKENFAIEVSLPNTELKRLPVYRNSISSLIVIEDNIIGGTSAIEGLTPYIFVASLKKRQVTEIKDLNDFIPGQQSIPTGFCSGHNNTLFAGTLANKNPDGSNGNGHLFRLDIAGEGGVTITDMGAPVRGEGILSLTMDTENNLLYGVSYPSGLFFKYSINSKEIRIYKDIAVTEKQIELLKEYELGPSDYLCKSLIQSEGLIFGSTPVNSLFCFDPGNDRFHLFGDIPEIWGRRTLGQVESWAESANGKIFGGNSGDGQLFEIDPVSKELKNLGKPIGMNRLRGLTFGKDGRLYGIAGGHPGYTHLFSYDEQEGFRDLGNPEFTMAEPGIEQGILWRGFQLGTITSSQDGRYIVMGEDESLSQLLIFAIEEKYEQRIGM